MARHAAVSTMTAEVKGYARGCQLLLLEVLLASLLAGDPELEGCTVRESFPREFKRDAIAVAYGGTITLSEVRPALTTPR